MMPFIIMISKAHNQNSYTAIQQKILTLTAFIDQALSKIK